VEELAGDAEEDEEEVVTFETMGWALWLPVDPLEEENPPAEALAPRPRVENV